MQKGKQYDAAAQDSHPSKSVLHRYSASVVMALAYGKYIDSADDPDVKAVFRCLRRVNSNLRLGLWKVDTYPFLKSVCSVHHISSIKTSYQYIDSYQVTSRS